MRLYAIISVHKPTATQTSASLAFFVLAMVLYPECQAKAQEELDAVIGSDRLPEFRDRESLPYLECLVQETLRYVHVVDSIQLLLMKSKKMEPHRPHRYAENSKHWPICRR